MELRRASAMGPQALIASLSQSLLRQPTSGVQDGPASAIVRWCGALSESTQGRRASDTRRPPASEPWSTSARKGETEDRDEPSDRSPTRLLGLRPGSPMLSACSAMASQRTWSRKLQRRRWAPKQRMASRSEPHGLENRRCLDIVDRSVIIEACQLNQTSPRARRRRPDGAAVVP